MRADPGIRPAVVKIEGALGSVDHPRPKLAIATDIVELPDVITVDARGWLEKIRIVGKHGLGQKLARIGQQLRPRILRIATGLRHFSNRYARPRLSICT